MMNGLYMSAAGVVANSYRQDVIANNLANAETTGFKRDLATFLQRPTEATARGLATTGPNAPTNQLLEKMGGGLLAMPTTLDQSQGDLEETGNPLDVAIEGTGYLKVNDGKTTHLTRDGQMQTDKDGNLILTSDIRQQVLDRDGTPIKLDVNQPTHIADDGTISQNGHTVAQLGLFNVADPKQVKKEGRNLLSVPDMKSTTVATDTQVRSNMVERANVDPTIELTQLMDTQRQLEANANMIRYQDSMLSKLVNEVGKIS